MKPFYRILPLVLSIGMVGCNNSSQPEATTKNNTEDKTQDTFVSSLPEDAPVLKVATTSNLAPDSFQDEYGNVQGIDIDIIRAIGEDQGFKVEFYNEPWQNLFDSVASGSRDLAISGISFNEERNAKYGLSIPYNFNPSAIMYHSGEEQINTLSDLKGKRVGVLDGSKQVPQIESVGGYESLSKLETGFLLYERLIQDKIDAALLDASILQYTAKNHPEYDVTIVPYEKASKPESYSVVLMAKGNDELINTINKGITNLKQKGTIDKIKERWLGTQQEESTTNDTATNKEGA